MALQTKLQWSGLNRLATLTVWSTFDLARTEALLGEAWSVAERSGDQEGLAETAWSRAQLAVYAYQPSAIMYADQALALSWGLERPDLIARSLNVAAHLQANAGQWAASLTCPTEASQLYAQLGDWAMEVDCLTLQALALGNLGRVDDARAVAQQAQAKAAQVNNDWTQCFAAAVAALPAAS